MDEKMLEAHLAQAECHVAEGFDRIERLYKLHDELLGSGHNETAMKAAQVIEEFEVTQAAFAADRDRLANELAKLRSFNAPP